jgi:dUTP pyrophosphatase
MIKVAVWNPSVPTQEPFRATPTSAGIDFYSDNVAREFEPGRQQIVPLNYAVQIPVGYYGQLTIRSSLAARGLLLLGGVIDNDYRGEVKAIVMNTSTVPYVLAAGTRFCQMLVLPVSNAGLELVTHRNHLGDTHRGTGGFGSTNV